MKFSIVPEILSTEKVRLLDENNVQVFLCSPSPFRFVSQFQNPFLIVDTFAKREVNTQELIFIDFAELKKLGFCFYSLRNFKKWRNRQMVMYVISKLPLPNSTKLLDIPPQHKIQKDRANNKLRIIGINAGYPHYSDLGGCSPWVDI